MAFAFSSSYGLCEIHTGRTSALATEAAGKIRIGTRASPLALAQANETRDRLLRAHPALSADDVEVVPLSTRGDRVLDKPLAEIGGKGLFTEEIESGLLDNSLDLAVHSMKDVPTELPGGLEIVCLLPREDVRDGFISESAESLAGLPKGALVGTASLRRQAQILRIRPDLRVAPLRGNIQTRLRKLKEGEADATLLAMAGLNRLGMADVVTAAFSVDEMLPAVAQGAIGIEARSDDTRIRDLLAPLNDGETAICVRAERALLRSLDGSCRTPIAAYARLTGEDALHLRAEILLPDGSESFSATREGARGDAEALGLDAGDELRRTAGPEFFDALG